ncbi:hypothetical protein GCM10010259_60000 [Streptomyces daghestanicus]|uniref:Uncharacterized protein n=1 Tax=Streptomyces daghestanicus TaxID=66885 RepID=A0ABQ3Q5X8_9ACTN|nr:hypothetical protein GCM10010259_60000 [Streptomyces daghestanicus]GHI32692.1 hypothetical protein Sdagh_44220 [Streptomyces daghestanicus]
MYSASWGMRLSLVRGAWCGVPGAEGLGAEGLGAEGLGAEGLGGPRGRGRLGSSRAARPGPTPARPWAVAGDQVKVAAFAGPVDVAFSLFTWLPVPAVRGPAASRRGRRPRRTRPAGAEP